MAGIGGIFSFNGLPLDEIRLSRLSDALIGCGADGGGEALKGVVGMVYRALHTNRESRLESQPLVSPDGKMVAWDGRLDNREDLLAHFPDGLNGDKTDIALVVKAYLKWDLDFLGKIVGDFALSLYDPRLGALLLARDPFGARSLYYVKDRDGIVWSSTLQALFASTNVGSEVDDEYIAGFLGLGPDPSRSPYRDVHPVEPGHLVVVSEQRLQVKRFWKLDPTSEIRYKTDAEYEERFLSLFTNAVRKRLRTDGPVWSELSGGLDSSSIVCIADKLINSGEAEADRLETISYIDDESETSRDHKFLCVIEEKRGKKGCHLRGNGQWVRFVPPEEAFISKPSTSLCVAGTHQRLCRALADGGARVLLSGLGGDQLLWSVPDASPELTDLIFQRRLRALHRQLQAWSLVQKQPYIQLLWQDGILPFLPTSARARLQSKIKIAPWLNQAFVKRTRLQEHLLLPEDPFGYRLPSKRLQSSMLFFIISKIARGDCSEYIPFERSYPFLDRPLVEFILQIPFEQKLRLAETRSLMRRSLRGVVPEKVLQRRSKGTVGETFCRGLAQEWENLKPMLVDARIYERGYVDRHDFISAITLARHGKEDGMSTILKLISLEIWLRSIEFWYGKVSGITKAHEATLPQFALQYNASTSAP